MGNIIEDIYRIIKQESEENLKNDKSEKEIDNNLKNNNSSEDYEKI